MLRGLLYLHSGALIHTKGPQFIMRVLALQASEDVRRTRGRLATLRGRLRSLLSNQPGEVTEQVQQSSIPGDCQLHMQCFSCCCGTSSAGLWRCGVELRSQPRSLLSNQPACAMGGQALCTCGYSVSIHMC